MQRLNDRWMGSIIKASVEESRRKGSTVRRVYTEKGRLIPQKLHNKLKSSKKCWFCQKEFDNEVPQIHHLKPVAEGGTNEESEL